MKRTIIDVLVIIAAVGGVTFLLKKGENAGAGKNMRVVVSPAKKMAETAPIRPRAILGRIDNFKETIKLEPIRSWRTTKYGITLAVSANPKLNRPSARVVLARPTTAPVVLEIQYTVAENMVQPPSGNAAIKNKTDGVTVLVSTVGDVYSQSTLLQLDPERRAAQRQWLTYNLALPEATREIHFSIIGPPPNYNVASDSCVVCLPQLRVMPAATPPPVRR